MLNRIADDFRGLTDGQRTFLKSLAPEQRAVYDSLPSNRKASMLAPHRSRYDPICGPEAAHTLKCLAKPRGYCNKGRL